MQFNSCIFRNDRACNCHDSKRWKLKPLPKLTFRLWKEPHYIILPHLKGGTVKASSSQTWSIRHRGNFRMAFTWVIREKQYQSTHNKNADQLFFFDLKKGRKHISFPPYFWLGQFPSVLLICTYLCFQKYNSWKISVLQCSRALKIYKPDYKGKEKYWHLLMCLKVLWDYF